MAPKSVTELPLLLLFVVPGFVYQAVRISVRGRLPLDLELSTRIMRAVVSSGIFGLCYLLLLGGTLVDAAHGRGFGFEHPRVGALAALAGGIAIPATLALIRRPRWRWIEQCRALLPQIATYDPTPTAWDKTFQTAGECFIRVLTNDGRWIAGYYGPASYASSYPEPRQLFLETAYDIAQDGSIGEPVVASKGVIVDCSAISLLQVLSTPDQEATS